jgi:hypothetical protein
MKTHQLSAAIFYAVTIAAAFAQSPPNPPPSVNTPPVIVMGNNPGWTRVSGVQANVLIRVYADGAVKFGPHSSTDTAVAGVEGNGFFKWLQGTFGGEWEKAIASPSQYAGMIKNAFGRSEPVNFVVGVSERGQSRQADAPCGSGALQKPLPRLAFAPGCQRVAT